MKSPARHLSIIAILALLSPATQAGDESTNPATGADPGVASSAVRQGRPDDLPARERAIPQIEKNDTPATEKAVPVILNIPWKDFEPASPKGHYPPGHLRQRGKGHQFDKGKGHEKFDPPHEP
jgi:hypothetical protein